jgi:hypothetical protein
MPRESEASSNLPRGCWIARPRARSQYGEARSKFCEIKSAIIVASLVVVAVTANAASHEEPNSGYRGTAPVEARANR